MIRNLLICFLSILPLSPSWADTPPAYINHSLYAGGMIGYGSTTWNGLVPSDQNQNLAISISTPKYTDEGGAVWGLLLGYEITPLFALEANYRRYPDADVGFDIDSLFAFENEDHLSFQTHTETFGVLAKFMVAITGTDARVFSGVGVTGLHRNDEILDDWYATPMFSLGINHTFKEHFMVELSGTFIPGHGESELNPIEDYFPFLISGGVSLAYRF